MAPQRNSSDKLLEAFYQLGFGNASAKLYCDLLPRGRILKGHIIIASPGLTIAELERAGLLHIDMDAMGHEYVIAVEPQIALNAIYAQRLWEYMPEEGWGSPDNLGTDAVKNLYDAKAYLISKLSPNYTDAYNGERGIRNIPADFSSNAMSLSLKHASNEILGITTPPWLSNISLIWETIKDRIEHGVVYRRLCDETTLLAFGHKINIRDIGAGVKLSVLLKESFVEKFFIIDESEAFIFVPGRPSEGFKLELMQVSFPPMVSVYRKKFEALWNMSVSGENIINFMNELRDDFLKHSANGRNKSEKQILEGIFDYGKFFKRAYVDMEQERLNNFLSELEMQGHIFPFSGSELGFLPNILDKLRKFITSNQGRAIIEQ